MKLVLAVIFFSLIFSSCATRSKKEVYNVVDVFYENYHNYNSFRTVDKTLLSKDLSILIEKTAVREKYEAEKIKKSDYPTDKPLMIEGEVFASLYEGYQTFIIEKIEIDNHRAIVTIELTNIIDEMTWRDEVLLIKEDGWKIDNVFYKGAENGYMIKNTPYKGQKQALTNLKSRLLHIINTAN